MMTTSGLPAPEPRSSSSREAASRAAERAYHNHVKVVQSSDGAPRVLGAASRLALLRHRYRDAPHKPIAASPVWSIWHGGFLNLPRRIVADAVCIAAFPVRHCVRVIAESCDSLDRMAEFLVG